MAKIIEEKTEAPHKWFVMTAVSMGVFLATIDDSIMNIALPILMNELNTDFAGVQWVVLAYLLAFNPRADLRVFRRARHGLICCCCSSAWAVYSG